MAFRKIDMTQDARRGQFEYFQAQPDPWAGVTVQVDITDFKTAVSGKPFFLSFLYVAMRAVNRIDEMRRRIVNGECVEYDVCPVSYTAMRENGAYAYVSVEHDLMDYEGYIACGKAQQEKALREEGLTEEEDPIRFIYVSCLPWLSYTGLKLPSGKPEECNPRISWGKYVEEDGRVIMPVSVFVHHALADGWHISLFYKYLEEEIKRFVNER